MSHIIIYFEG